LGVLCLLITPPFQAPDEQNHFFRTYQISKGELISRKLEGRSGGFVPNSLVETASQFNGFYFNPKDTLALLATPLNRNQQDFVDFRNLVPHSPLVYAPQSIGISFGKLLDVSPLALMYLGRFTNLCVSLLLIFLAIHITPVFKRFFFLLMLSPMALFQMSSLSADSLTNSLSLLFVAFILHYALTSKDIKKNDMVLFFLVFVAMALIKMAYTPLLLLFILIPTRKFGSQKRYFLFFGLLIFISVLVAGFWSLLVLRVYLPQTWYGADLPEQTRFILLHPIKFVSVLFYDLFLRQYGFVDELGNIVFRDSYIRQMGILGRLDAPIPSSFMNFWWGLLLLVALIDGYDHIHIKIQDKLKIFVVFSLTLFFALTLQYVCCTSPGANYVYGQGRYLLPLLPLSFLLFYNRTISTFINTKANRIYSYVGKLAIGFSSVSALATFITLTVRYYGFQYWWT
jgi:uncharacterized membrane protein